MKTTFLATVLCFLALSASAQNPDAQRRAIDRLAFLEGEWSGEATATLPDGSRLEMNQVERVSRKADGLAMTIEGTGTDKRTGEVAFEAFAAVYQDFQSDAYRMYGVTSDGRNGEMGLEVMENGVRWWPKGMEQRVRYTINISEAGEWIEHGEFSTDGQNWTTFFEMTLTKDEEAGAP